MPPTVALVGLGRQRWWVPLPLPVVLAWPLAVLVLGVAAVVEAVARRGERHGAPSLTKAVLLTLSELRGLEVDIRRAGGGRLLVWLL